MLDLICRQVSPQQKLLADLGEERAIEPPPRAGVAGFAGQLEPHLENIVLRGAVNRQPNYLDHAKVIRGEPDAGGEAADGSVDVVFVGEAGDVVGGEVGG